MRIWRTAPFVALVAVIALAMGIGFTTTMFSIVHGATRPLPFADADEIVAVQRFASGATSADASTRPFEYSNWQRATSFSALAAYESVGMNVAGDGAEPERRTGVAITSNTFAMLATPAALGRTLQAGAARAGAAPAVVIGHGLWRRRFGADPGILGRTIRLSGAPYLVVGVMPERFGFPVNASFWTPRRADELSSPPRTGPSLQVFGRLAPGVTMGRARAELETLGAETSTAGVPAEAAIRVRVIAAAMSLTTAAAFAAPAWRATRLQVLQALRG